MKPLLETCRGCFLKKYKSNTYIKICTCCWSKESSLFAGGQERWMKFFYAKVNSRNSDISLSVSCPRILVQLAVGQKQINLTRKREAVFTGNHAATEQTKRDKERRRFLSAKESVANAPSDASTPTTEWTSCWTGQLVPHRQEREESNSMGNHCYLSF